MVTTLAALNLFAWHIQRVVFSIAVSFYDPATQYCEALFCFDPRQCIEIEHALDVATATKLLDQKFVRQSG